MWTCDDAMVRPQSAFIRQIAWDVAGGGFQEFAVSAEILFGVPAAFWVLPIPRGANEAGVHIARAGKGTDAEVWSVLVARAGFRNVGPRGRCRQVEREGSSWPFGSRRTVPSARYSPSSR